MAAVQYVLREDILAMTLYESDSLSNHVPTRIGKDAESVWTLSDRLYMTARLLSKVQRTD